MVKVSIIVPVYNTAKYLNKCINSLLNQTLKEIEIILINDGSTDNCESIIKKYKDKRIKYISKKNEGIGKTRNLGIEIASGEYLAFIDSDDYIESKFCEVMYNKAIKDKCDIVICDYFEDINNELKEIKFASFKDTNLMENPEIINYINLGPCNKIYKKELIKDNNILFKKGVWFEDVEFTYRLLPYINSIGVVKEKFYNYVQRDGAITRTFDERMYHYIDNLNGVVEFYKNNNFYNEYEKELEYIYVRYLYATFIKGVSKYKDDEKFEKAVKEAIKNVNLYFPKYRKNKYFYKSIKGLYLVLFNYKLAKIVRKKVNKNEKEC